MTRSTLPRKHPSIARLALIALALVTATAAQAASLPLSWDAVQDGDLDGYTVYFGTSPGSYPDSRDAGNSTSYTLTGLDPCTRYYIAVKAYDVDGLESDAFSNEVSGLPTPAVTSVTPSDEEQGRSVTVSVIGSGFDSGAMVELSHPGITVGAVTVVSCTELEATFSVDAGAAPGFSDVDVVNPDQSFGRLDSGFEVRANAAPTVASTNPADGAADVPLGIQPSVSFSEAMDAASVTSATVRLLRPDGSVVPQAGSSPSLSPGRDVATILPAAELDGDTVYRIEVVGGAGGVLDETGMPMDSTYAQNPGFTTTATADTEPPLVSGTDPADGQRQVQVEVHPTVTFSEPMDPASISQSTVRLLAPDGTPVAQAPSSPSLDPSGTVATVQPAQGLQGKSWYRIQILGGPTGARDLAGNAMVADYLQNPGFETRNTPPGQVRNLRRRDRKN